MGFVCCTEHEENLGAIVRYNGGMQTLLISILSLPVLVVGDLLWLGFIMRDFYRSHLGHLMADTVYWPPALLFYFMYPLAVVYLVVLPNMHAGLGRVMLMSALMGAFAYATYDLTNHATLRNWPLVVTIVDVLWGAFLTTLIGTAAYFIKQYLG